MSYQLRVDEIMQALIDSAHPQARICQKLLEDTTTRLAVALARHLGIRHGVGEFEGLGFAGTCVSFYPAYAGQPLPSVLADNAYDDAEEWAPDNFPPVPVDLAEASAGFTCGACGRPEADCSANPCPDVEEERVE